MFPIVGKSALRRPCEVEIRVQQSNASNDSSNLRRSNLPLYSSLVRSSLIPFQANAIAFHTMLRGETLQISTR